MHNIGGVGHSSQCATNTVQMSDPQVLKALAETGLLAISQGEIKQAQNIFNYLLNVRPGAFITDLGFAFIALANKEFATASSLLQRHSQSEQDGHFAHAFLALVCYLNNDLSRGLVYAQQAMAGNNELAAQLARELSAEIKLSGENQHDH